MKTVCSCLIAAACFFVFPTAIQAQTKAGLFKIQLDTVLFSYGLGEVDRSSSNDRSFGDATAGLGMANAGIGLGYTVIDRLVIGGRIALGIEGYDDYFWDAEGFRWSVMPFLEYVFLDKIFRPFIMLSLGFEGYSTEDVEFLWQGEKTSWWGFRSEIAGGGHVFVHEVVSLDFTLGMAFVFGNGEVEVTTSADDLEFKHWRFDFSALVGLSVWI
jgi:hypothetical protein